eukprot:COSAG05_NODE_7602_length_791_cov_1.031792_1_plen_34_part_10
MVAIANGEIEKGASSLTYSPAPVAFVNGLFWIYL